MKDFRLYVYGRADAALWSLLKDAELHRRVGDLLAGGEVRSAPGAAVDRGLLAENAGGLYGPGEKMVLVPAGPEDEVRRLVEPMLDRYAEVASAAIPRLRRTFGATAAARCFSWEQAEHALVAGLLLDLGVGRELRRAGWIERQPWEAVVWVFERVSAANSFGVQWVGHAAGRCGFAQLWHRDVRRDDLVIDEAAVALLGRLAAGERPAASPRSLLHLRYLKLLEPGDRELRPAVPAFGADDFDLLLGPLVEGARRLTAEAVVPALEGLRDHPWWGRGRDDGSHRHAAVRLILEYGVDRVIAEGLLGPFPQGAPEPAWGRWIWVESGGPLTQVAGVFHGTGMEAAAP